MNTERKLALLEAYYVSERQYDEKDLLFALMDRLLQLEELVKTVALER
jgi:hypothetical protein